MKKQKKQNNNGVIYARYSSHRQNDMSIEQQVALCRRLAENNGITVIDEYADRAVTGKTDKRPAFQRMMTAAASGSFGYVIAWKSNRIGRNMLEALVNQETLNNYGIKIIYVEEDFEDNAAGRFAMRSMMNVNQFYSENMAEDIARGMRANAEKCLITNGQAPLGYKIVDKRYVIDTATAPVVREIFERFNAGQTYADIADALNKRHIRTGRGGEFKPNSFHRILHNERYRGIYIYDDIRIEGGVPRIIDDATFFLAQKNLDVQAEARHRHGSTVEFILTGKIFCGECGAPMSGTSGTSKNGNKHYYYICRNKKDGLCEKRPVKKDAVERTVAEAIKENILQPDVIEWICDQAEAYAKKQAESSDVHQLAEELKDVDKKIDNIMKAVENGIFTASTRERLEDLEARKSELERTLTVAAAMQFQFRREDAYEWLDRFRSGDVDNVNFQKALFDTFLRAVYVFDDGRIKIVFDLHGGKTEELTLSDLTDDSVRLSDTLDHQTFNRRTQITFIHGLLVLSVGFKVKP